MNPATKTSLRLLVEPLRRVDLEDLPVTHHRDPLPQRHRLDLVVGHVHRRHPELLVQLRERRAHAHAQLRVEVREGLVHEERLGLAHDRAAHRDSLALAAGELGRPPLEELVQAEHRGDLLDASRDLALGHPPHLQAVAEVLANAHVRVQGVALEDHRDVAVTWREIGDVAPADPDLAGRDLLEPRDRAQQRRLPAARGTDQRDELAVLDPQRDVVHGGDSAGEDLRHAIELDLCHVGVPYVARGG